MPSLPPVAGMTARATLLQLSSERHAPSACLKGEQQFVALEQSPARVLVHGEGVMLVDDVATIGYAVLLPCPAALNATVEEVYVSVQGELFISNGWVEIEMGGGGRIDDYVDLVRRMRQYRKGDVETYSSFFSC